ncbi:hypothetical protein Fcan01_28465 [Folsomia candida]|uniref:Uncharacterized protein n=2 Tax=Folsomia candida TaxID=158441 RepID=A0A226CVH8_FOLCA|nr:hypothetical protein Fcan01_28701 [Folsomia candida]OXA36770.1 hypothetical protein Fcan01_28465 [Folsomia candida]
MVSQIYAIYEGIMTTLPPRQSLIFETNFHQSYANFMTTQMTNSTTVSIYPGYLDTFLGLVDILSSIFRMHVAYDVDYLLFTVALGLWVPCKYFSELLKDVGNKDASAILEMFDDLTIYLGLLNEIFSGLVVSNVVDVVLYYSIHLMDLVIVPSIVDRAALTTSILFTVGTFYFAAESCATVGFSSVWLRNWGNE